MSASKGDSSFVGQSICLLLKGTRDLLDKVYVCF